jgi:DNA-binding NtrC family response regulator
MIEFPLKVMVIDDDKDVLLLMDAYLKDKEDIEVLLYENPVEALEELSKGEVKCVFTDISMPEKNGEVLIREIVALRLGIAIIALTGYKSLMVMHSCFRAGARSFLKKPIKSDEIDIIIEDIKKHFHSWNELFHDARKEKNQNN